MKLRGAVIGCGMISEYHLRAWQRIPEVEIVALVDVNLEQALQKSKAFASSAKIFPDIESMLDETGIDFVDILTPPWLHREHCLQAAGKNVHLICQKPLCDSLEEAESLVNELSQYPKRFSVHENHPFRPWFIEVLKLYRDGFFGDDLNLTLTQHEPKEPPEQFKAESENGIMLDYGIHFIAMARTLLGEPESVDAVFSRINPRVRGESKAEVGLKFPRASARIALSWQDHGTFAGGFSLVGDRGEAHLAGTCTRGDSSRFRLIDKGKILRDEIRCPTEDFSESFFYFQRAFIDAWLHGTPAPQPVTDNLETLRTTFAAYDSALSGQPVSIANKPTPQLRNPTHPT